jgi:hypothetical protein
VLIEGDGWRRAQSNAERRDGRSRQELAGKHSGPTLTAPRRARGVVGVRA